MIHEVRFIQVPGTFRGKVPATFLLAHGAKHR